MDTQQFENLITEAVAALPEGIRQKLDNVEITMEEGESPNNSLFGLYHGVSQLNRGSTYGMGGVLPDKITIFQKPIEAICRTEDEIITEVGRVVKHEIAHYFGISDARLREIGRY